MILNPETCVCQVPRYGGLMTHLFERMEHLKREVEQICTLTKDECDNPNFEVDLESCTCQCNQDAFCYNNMILDPETCVCGVPPGGHGGLLTHLRGQLVDEPCTLTVDDCDNPNYVVNQDTCACECLEDTFCYNNMVINTDTCVCEAPENFGLYMSKPMLGRGAVRQFTAD